MDWDSVELRYMLDTDLCVRILRDRPKIIRERFTEEIQRCCVSIVTFSELLYRAEKTLKPWVSVEKVEDLIETMQVLPFGQNAAAHFASIRVDLERRCQIIGPRDLMVAAHARSLGLTLVTANLEEFKRVHGLSSEDWDATA